MPRSRVRFLTLTALMVAIGVLLPIAFHAVSLGKALLPMHIPVLLAGFLVGPLAGLIAGLLTPLLSALLTGMPPLAPAPIAQMMCFELATYGLLSGLVYRKLGLGALPSLLLAMLGGRLVYGLLGALVLPLFGLTRVPLLYPLTAGLLSSIPGVVVQILCVPAIVAAVERNAGAIIAGRPAAGPQPARARQEGH